jgi:hypothetical protein
MGVASVNDSIRTAQQFRMVASGIHPHRYVIHERDRIRSEGVDRAVAAMGSDSAPGARAGVAGQAPSLEFREAWHRLCPEQSPEKGRRTMLKLLHVFLAAGAVVALGSQRRSWCG